MTSTNLKPWKPGQSGNPAGFPKLPAELRGIHSLTQLEVCKLVSKYARMTKDELQAAVQSNSTPMIEIAIASIFAQSAKRGDYARLAFLLDRAIGKPKDEVMHDGPGDGGGLAGLTDEELIKLLRDKVPQLRAG